MIHGRWLKGSDDLTALGRYITDEDRYSWHLIVDYEGKVSRCSLTPYNDSFRIRELKASDAAVTELMLRMIGAKLDGFNKPYVYADAETNIEGFGFKPYAKGILRTEKLLLPRHCKE